MLIDVTKCDMIAIAIRTTAKVHSNLQVCHSLKMAVAHRVRRTVSSSKEKALQFVLHPCKLCTCQ